MLLGCYHEEPHTPLLSLPHLGTHVGPLLPGSRQIQLAVPGAYEKPQLLPLEPSVEAGLPATFTFHVNPVLSSRLDVELGEQLTVLQVSEPVAWERAVRGAMVESVQPGGAPEGHRGGKFSSTVEGSSGVPFCAERPEC